MLLPSLLLAASAVQAAVTERGITPTTILIGQAAEFSGPAAAKENTQGAQAYFELINRQGGINGRKLELKSYDDQRDPKKTTEVTKKLIEDDGVFLLFAYRSTPAVEAAVPMAMAAHMPLIAPITGARSLYNAYARYVFPVRASYQTEAAKIIEQVDSFGVKKVAILYQDDAFGKDALEGFDKAMKLHNITASVVAKYDRKESNVDAAVVEIAKAAPQAVLMACSTKACSDFVKKMKLAGKTPFFMTLSNVSSDEFIQMLDGQGRGVGITQVVPYPWDTGTPIVREFQTSLKAMKNPPAVSYAALEGYIAAKVLVEGLRRTGANLTRERFVAAMEDMKAYDVGGFTVGYDPAAHSGSRFVDITVIGRDGHIMK